MNSADSRTYAYPPVIAAGEVETSREFGLLQIIGLLVERRWLILASSVLGLLTGAIYLYAVTPIYSADALLQIEDQKAGGLAALEEVTSALEGSTPTIAEIEILRSRNVLGQVVGSLKLDLIDDPLYFPLIGRALARRYKSNGLAEPPLPFLRRYAWGGEKLSISSFELPDALLGEQLVLRAGADNDFELLTEQHELIGKGKVAERLEVAVAGGVVRLFVTELIARPATEFKVLKRSPAKAYSNIALRLKVGERGRQSGILALTYEDPNPRRAAVVVNEIAQFYLRQNVERRSAEAAKSLKFLEQQLPELKTQVNTAEQALNGYLIRRGSVDMSKETEAVLNQVVSLESELLTFGQKRQELIERFTPQHPSVQTVDAQIASIQKEIDSQSSRIQNLPEAQQEVLRLQRDVQVATSLYTSLLNTAQELKLAREGTIGNVRVIDFALTPELPVRPNGAMVILFSLFMGVFVGVAAAIALYLLLQGVEDPDVIERGLGLPVYGVIPHSREQVRLAKAKLGVEAIGVLATLSPLDVTVEAIRSLRTALGFAASESGHTVLAISGPSPDIGKSFVSVNLAAVLAASGYKVVLVDGDMRRGYLQRFFALPRAPGLSELLSGQKTLDEVLNRQVVPGVDLITTGTIPPNPAELLLTAQTPKLLATLREQYDWVLVDTPPILAVTDAAILGQHTDFTLLVVKSGQHSMREIQQTHRRLQQAGIDVKGVVVNDVKARAGYGYGYGYGGYSHYDYSKPQKDV